MDVAVIGCGYVGLVTGVTLASIGHTVVGIDSDASRVDAIHSGRAPFHEPGLDELLRESLERGAFAVSTTLESAADADVVLLAVQTPPREDGGVELGHVEDATRALGAVLAAAPARRRVVAIRSTVPPGTNEQRVAPLLAGVADLVVVSNPEFLREGTAVDDLLHADRVVVGASEPWAADVMRELYEPIGAAFLVTSPATAELAKYASNAFLATLVSFSNELARISERTPGVDVEDVLGIVHLDRRLAPDGRPAPIVSFLMAGCGYGGSCLPKDIAGLAGYGRALGETTPLLEAVAAVNAGQASRLVDLAENALGSLSGRRIAVLGAAFKAGTDDLRHSSGLAVLQELRDRGATAVVFDPLVAADALAAAIPAGAIVAETLDDALDGTAACLVTTAAPEWRALDEHPTRPLVVDGRRALDPARYDGRYVAIGRAS
jgi:nucleotide sugar dehydrogenase